MRRSTIDNPSQTPITSVRGLVDTLSRSLLPNVPPTPLNTTILSASNIQIKVDTSRPTVTDERRRIPNTQIDADISIPTVTVKSRPLPDPQITVDITTCTATVKCR